MKQRITSALWALCAAAPLLAQDAAALAQQCEAAVVEALLSRADALAANKQFQKALTLRQLVVQEWAPGEGRALSQMGFVEFGGQWRRDANKVVLDRDQKGDPKALKKLDQEWAKTQKELGRQMEAAARALAEAGQPERALRFWRRLLWLRPGDKAVLAAIDEGSFDGHTGSPRELALLRRGRAIRQAVEFALQWQPEVAASAEQNALLAAAGMPQQCMQSAHFRVWGTLPPEKLALAAGNAERALLLCRMLFADATGALFAPKKRHDLIWTGDRAAYARILDAAKDQFDAARLRFLKEDVDLAFVRVGEAYQRLYVQIQNGGDAYLADVSARGVVQDAAGVTTDGLWEGIGHAAVFLLFDKTLSFFVEQSTAQTVTAWQPKPLLPDMESWRLIAQESAWAKNDTPLQRLVLLAGHKMSNEERVKAWSVCNYLLHENPRLLLQLDQSKTDQVRDPEQAAASFLQLSGVSAPDLDAAWRDYWGGMESLRKAMAEPPAGKREAVVEARKIAHALMRVRADADLGPCGFVVSQSDGAQQVEEWLVQVEKHKKEEAKKKPKPGQPPTPPTEPPPPPACIGHSIVFHEGADVEVAVAAWVADPAVRNFVLQPNRRILSCARLARSLVLDLVAPAAPLVQGPPLCWPADGAKLASQQAAGLSPSLHFFRAVDAAMLAGITCKLTHEGRVVPGKVVVLQGRSGLDADGAVAFEPETTPRAGACEVEWTVPPPLLGDKGQPQPRARFSLQP